MPLYNPATAAASDGLGSSIVTTKGDLITATANNTPVRLGVGTNGQALVSASEATNGVKWGGDHGEAVRKAWLPTGVLLETSERRVLNVAAAGTTGVLYLTGGIVIPASMTITNITFRVSAGATLTTPTHQWFCLVKAADLSVLAKTSDDTNVAWSVNTAKTLALSATYTPTVDTPVYVGILITAATLPTVLGCTGVASANGAALAVCGTSTTGLTDPASLGATAAAITGTAQSNYAALS